MSNKIYNIDEELIYERYHLVIERIKEIKDENSVDDKYKDFFINMVGFIEDIDAILNLSQSNKILELDIDELKNINRRIYKNIFVECYKESYGNPTYVVNQFGRNIGKPLTVMAASLFSLIPYAFQGRIFEITIMLELFIEIYNYFEDEDEYIHKYIKNAIYHTYFDYSDVFAEERVRDLLDIDFDFYYKIIMESDFNDLRYLYRYGKYVTENEIKTAEFINQLPDDEIQSMARTFTEGFRKGFENNNIDLSKKSIVNIRYFLGFEKVVKQAALYFDELGLKPTFTVYSTSPNRQCDYDHRFDFALYYNKALKEKRLSSLKLAFEKYKDFGVKFAGPAVMEVYGEDLFAPEDKRESLKLNKRQQKVFLDYNNEASILNNIYMKRSETSFTIIAYPIPEIGKDFEAIFRDTVKLNTLDAELYERIQQNLIDALDQGEYVRVVGEGNNKTDMKVVLYPLKDSSKETIFENCVADVNIPVGEVFTSPVLKGTSGILHVPRIYLRDLEYKNLELHFKDGKIVDYFCTNFDNEESNKIFIKENLLNNHDTLPLGEFAIGTNTAAYVMARKYNIPEKLPILIAEKTGPHFAVGDTCYRMSEDNKVYNPNGKEIIARDNEISILRKTEPDKAYYNCHTDITLPFDELKEISVHTNDGDKILIIEKGRFVLSGTEELNKELEEN